MREQVDGRGWKFLTPYGSTQYEGQEFYYPLPQPGEKWGAWIQHPTPAEPDGSDCGPGRLHVMNKLSAQYAPNNWWVWFCEYRGVIGRNNEKTGVRELRLRRVTNRVFWRIIRLGWCGANLRDADLTGADLTGVKLTGVKLTYADIRYAKLTGAGLTYADIRYAKLTGADLTGADLTGADLTGAGMRYAKLTHAGMRYANLTHAGMRYADLTHADLTGADLRYADLTHADLTGAYLPDNWKDVTYHD